MSLSRSALGAMLLSLSTFAACDSSAPPAGPQVAITVSPLSLPEVTNARYRITVRTPTDTVWTAEVDADDYGDGRGAVTYVGPCDAQSVNTVELTVLDLYDGANPIDPTTWVNPTEDGPLTRSVPCIPNADQLVEFNLTILRSARQGFFDVAVNFEDVFCSAKLDCRDADGPLTLVAHPGTGERLPSAVLALACTAGPNTDTHLYLTELVVTCGDNVIGIPVTTGPGNLYDTTSPAPPPLAQVMTFTGQEQLTQPEGPLGKLYFNTAIGIDFANLVGTNYASGCTLSLRATATDGPLEDCTTPTETTYPILALDAVPFIAANASGFACTNHPLGSPSFPITYTTTTPQVFSTEVDADATGVTVTACEVEPAPDTVDVTGRVYEDLDGDGAFTPGEERAGVQLEFMIDTNPGANLDFVPLPRTATSNTTGHYLLEDIPVRTPLCWRRVDWPAGLGTVQCGLTLTPTPSQIVQADLAVRSSCVSVASDDVTCDGIDDDCDGAIDEDANPLACDPCLANTDCCSGLCLANVCVGPALPNVIAGNLAIDGPGTLPPDYECITEVTGLLQIAPNPINGPLPPLNFASLESVGGGFIIVGTSTIASAHFPLLTDIGAGFTHYGTEPLLLSLPALDTVGSYLFFYGDALTLALPSLSNLSVPITIAPLAPAAALDLSFSALATGESVFVYGITASSSIGFPALTSLTGSVVAGYTDADPNALSFPTLTSIGGDLQVAGSASNSPGGTLWPDLSTFASVQSIDRLIVRNNDNLTALGLTSLSTVSDSVIIRWNTALDCALAQALLGQLGSTPPTISVNGNLAGCSLP